MWIFCCGMPRSGSTLQFQLTAKLVEDAGLGKRIEWCRPAHFPEIRDKYAKYKKWKVFKSHVPTEEMMVEFSKKNAKGVYIFRDIRDAIVSNLRKKSIEFDQILRKKFISRWIKEWVEYYNKWLIFPEVHVSKYENVVSDLAGEVRRIAEHLDISLSEEKCVCFAKEYELDKQRLRIEKFKKTVTPEKISSNEVIFDPHNMLHIDHIQSGKIGVWKQVLTRKEIKMIESNTKKWLQKNDYKLSVF